MKRVNYKDTSVYKKGYTLLFAVLVSSLVLAIGISILNISKKEFLLATSARDSSAAFYAADGGVECAAYGDQTYGSFSTSTTPTAALSCGEAQTTPVLDDINAATTTFTFSVKFGKEAASCADITVQKGYANGSEVTIIDARGYNLGWNEQTSGPCNVQSPKKVERGLRLSY